MLNIDDTLMSETTANEFFLLACIAKYMKKDDRTAFPSLATLCKDTGFGKQLLLKTKESLIEKGLLTCTNQVGKNGNFVSNLYIMKTPKINLFINKGSMKNTQGVVLESDKGVVLKSDSNNLVNSLNDLVDSNELVIEQKSAPTFERHQFNTPESLYAFAVNVFSDELKVNGIVQTYAQNKMVYNPTQFDLLLNNWAMYQIEHDNSYFTEKTLYAGVLRWVSNQKRFDNQNNNSKNGNNGNGYAKPKSTGSKHTSRINEFIEAATNTQPAYAVECGTIDWSRVE